MKIKEKGRGNLELDKEGELKGRKRRKGDEHKGGRWKTREGEE